MSTTSDEKLAVLIADVGHLRDENRDQHAGISSTLTRINEVLHGNGKVGLVTEVDRLKQIETARKWWVRSITVMLLTLVAEAARRLMV